MKDIISAGGAGSRLFPSLRVVINPRWNEKPD